MSNISIEEKKTKRHYIPKIVILFILLVVAIIFAYYLRSIFNPLIVAFILAYIFNPLINFLEKRKIRRTVSILSLYLILLIIIICLVSFLFPVIIEQLSNLAYNIVNQEKIKKLSESILGKLVKEDILGKAIEEIQKLLKENVEKVAENIGQVISIILTTLISSITGFLTVISYLLLVPIYMFFILKNMDTGWESFKQYLPVKVIDSLEKINIAIRAFFRGVITVSIIKGILLFVGLTILDIRFSIIFGLMYAILCIIPYVGVFTTFTATTIFTLIDAGLSTTLLFVVIIFVVIEFIDNLLLTPAIIGKKVGLHPIEVILAILISEKLFGFFGLLIAIPLAATIKIIFKDHLLPNLKEPTTGKP